MSENEKKKEKPYEDSKEQNRIFWLDHAKGSIMIFLVITMYLPRYIREGPARFFLAHPENSTTTMLMNFYDIGAPVFILIMGLLMPLSFFRRKEKYGVNKALKHLSIRYGVILFLGLLVILIDHGNFIKMEDGAPVIVTGMVVILWDVLPTLGLVGLIAIPFLWLKPKVRAIMATILLIFYQLMLLYGGWREYAIESIHGGILGTIFGFSALMIFATCFGEFLLLNKEYNDSKKYKIFAVLGAIILIVGLLIAFIPEWYPNKRQATLSYILISMGASVLISFVFIAIDKKLQKPIFLLDGYGKSIFLIYIIAVVLRFLIVDVIGYELDLLIGISLMVIITIIVIVLDYKGKIVKL
ncbi:MAG: hypothetical protein ACTSRI_01790 [Promethearchaeota archaeon]